MVDSESKNVYDRNRQKYYRQFKRKKIGKWEYVKLLEKNLKDLHNLTSLKIICQNCDKDFKARQFNQKYCNNCQKLNLY